jgi:malate synthase
MTTSARQVTTRQGQLEISAPVPSSCEAILSPEALEFVADLGRTFSGRVRELLDARAARQVKFDGGESLKFLPETKKIREGSWTVAPLPPDLQDRRVEITGPVSRKMVINALNSGANVFMADFEDATAPRWTNLIEGQQNLYDALRRTIDFTDEGKGKEYRLNDEVATLFVRPRGWHLWEDHLRLEGQPLPGGLVDFGLYFFHNAKELLSRGRGPYFYLPKLESHREARLWNDVFIHAQRALGVSTGTIKATVLIETLPAAFEMNEILWELREHSAGLNCGRWDYIFSFIKTFRGRGEAILPDRGQVTMEQPFMRAYTQLVIQTCHRRGVHAMGGMAAQIPIKQDPQANEEALGKVRADKLREVTDGHDGTWVAHPALVPLARDVFDAHMKGPNQLDRLREDIHVDALDLVQSPKGTRTEQGLRNNISVGIQYLAAWLSGNGCVPLYHLMEDAATAEIARTQVWQWLRHGATLDDGRAVDQALVERLIEEETPPSGQTGPARYVPLARKLFTELVTADQAPNFLTLSAYELIKQVPPDSGRTKE